MGLGLGGWLFQCMGCHCPSSGVCAGTLPSWLGSLARETQYIHQYIKAFVINMVIHARKGFPGGSVMKNPPADAGAVGSNAGSGRSPGVGNSIPCQYSCLENSMDRGTWRASVHGVTKSWTQLNDWARTHTRTHTPGGKSQRCTDMHWQPVGVASSSDR